MSLMNVLDTAAMVVLNSRSIILASNAGTGEGENASGSTFDASSGITGEIATDGPFGNVTTAISDGGNSLVYIIMMLVGFCGVIGFGITALKLMVGGSATKSGAKGEIGWIMVGLALGFGAMAIVGLVQGVASGLFSGETVTPT